MYLPYSLQYTKFGLVTLVIHAVGGDTDFSKHVTFCRGLEVSFGHSFRLQNVSVSSFLAASVHLYRSMHKQWPGTRILVKMHTTSGAPVFSITSPPGSDSAHRHKLLGI